MHFFQKPYKFKKDKLSSLQNVLIFNIFVVGYFCEKKKKKKFKFKKRFKKLSPIIIKGKILDVKKKENFFNFDSPHNIILFKFKQINIVFEKVKKNRPKQKIEKIFF